MDKTRKKLSFTGTMFFVSLASELYKFLADARAAYLAFVAELLLTFGAATLVTEFARLLKGAFICAAVLSVFLCSVNFGLLVPVKSGDFVTVIHSGGGRGYYNSYTTTQMYLEKGYDLIELGFLFTEDGALVCSHEFEYGGYSVDDRPTLEEFEQIVFTDGLSGMTSDELIFLMSWEESFRVVFDTKEEDIFSVIDVLERTATEEGVDFYGRFVVQFYEYEEYERLRDYPFAELWFTNYKAGYSSSEIRAYFGEDERVTTVVLSEDDWLRKACFDEEIEGKKIAVHTVNDEGLAKFYARRGADYIFSDLGFC